MYQAVILLKGKHTFIHVYIRLQSYHLAQRRNLNDIGKVLRGMKKGV